VLIPIRTFMRRIAGDQDVSTIYVAARPDASTEKVQKAIELLLRERRRIGRRERQFLRHGHQGNHLDADRHHRVMTGLLSAVAAVSLLVGGIGIMNIMLVSVTERTREIGIRLAIGATEGQVLMQFLVEAIVLSLFGGLIGIGLGLALGYAGSVFMKIPFSPDWTMTLVAFAFSAFIGIVFGYFPARRAARLDPIEALRHE
jgi:putative ABC transport system permease protein